MKKSLLVVCLVLLSLILCIPTVFATQKITSEEKHFSFYGVHSTHGEHESTGLGMYFDSEFVKLKTESCADFFRTGAVLKFELSPDIYLKTGATFINENVYATNDQSGRVNQYGGSLGLGYKYEDTLFFELGMSYVQLKGGDIGDDYTLADEITQSMYFEAVKRFEGQFGTLDLSSNIGETFHESGSDEHYWGLGLNYYPTAYSKLSAFHNHEQGNKYTTYEAGYKLLTATYRDCASGEHEFFIGVKFAFDNLLDPSTYAIPTNILPDISENDKFEQLTFSALAVQSSTGVQLKNKAEASEDAESSEDASDPAENWLEQTSITVTTTSEGNSRFYFDLPVKKGCTLKLKASSSGALAVILRFNDRNASGTTVTTELIETVTEGTYEVEVDLSSTSGEASALLTVKAFDDNGDAVKALKEIKLRLSE